MKLEFIKGQGAGYIRPVVKVIAVKATNVLCVSGDATERFTVNEDNSLNDSDWD